MVTNEVKINCIAIDDEPLALNQMQDYIKKISFLRLCGVFDNAVDALNFLKTHQVDLIFLDVEMDEFSGIQFLEVLDKKPFIILITAYESYALKGYELEVTDYILKPVSYQRLVKSVNRIYDKVTATQMVLTSDNNKDYEPKEFMFVRTKHQHQKIFFAEINYLESMSNYVILRLKNETVYTITSLQKILEMLPANNFIRVHKSFIIALDKIEKITKNNIVIGDKNIPVGQLYKHAFFEQLRKNKMIE